MMLRGRFFIACWISASVVLAKREYSKGIQRASASMLPEHSSPNSSYLVRKMKSFGGRYQKREDSLCGTDVRKEAPSVVLLSGTGEGKSTTACVMSGNPALARTAEEVAVHSETSESCVFQTSWFGHDGSLDIVDTPGFGDSRGEKTMLENNKGIRDILRHAGRIHVVLWVLNYENQKMNQGRKDAFRFVRTYFGQKMYDHLIFAYTRFSWDETGKDGKGNGRLQTLHERHKNMLQGLLDQVESEFWPDGVVPEKVAQKLLSIPHFGINTYVQKGEDGGEDDGEVWLEDENLPEDADFEDPEVVYQEEAYGKLSPNSASQVREIKKTVLKIASKGPMDVSQLRDLLTSCEDTLKHSQDSDTFQFGQHLCDCFEGDLIKLRNEKVIPHVKSLPEYATFVPFAVKAYQKGSKTDIVESDIINAFDIAKPDWQTASDFHDYAAFKACGAVLKTPLMQCSASCMAGVAQKLAECFQGSETGRTPQIWAEIEGMFSAGKLTPTHISKFKNAFQKLDDSARAAVEDHIDVDSLVEVAIPISIQVNRGMEVSSSRIMLTVGSGNITSVKRYVFQDPMVQSLESKEWLAGVSLKIGSDGITKDDQLRRHLRAGMKTGDTAESTGITAILTWSPGKPPARLSPELLEICLQENDIEAIESLVRDHVLNLRPLAIADEPKEILPNTYNHGGVYSRLLELRKEGRAEFKRETDADFEAQIKDQDKKLKRIDEMKEKMQKYIDEVKKEAEDRREDVQKLNKKLRDKTTEALEQVKTANANLPDKVPDIDDPTGYVDFMNKLEDESSRIRDLIAKPVLPPAVLLMQSQITKGRILGSRGLGHPKQELVTITGLPDWNELLTNPQNSQKQYERSSRLKQSISSAKESLRRGQNSWATSAEASGAYFTGSGVMAGTVSAKLGSDLQEAREMRTRSREEIHSFTQLQVNYMPMRNLAIDDKYLRLSTPVLEKVVKILRLEREEWRGEFQELFEKFGTHYCPAVTLGGIWMRTGEFNTRKQFSETQAKKAISSCFEADVAAAASYWGFSGGGSVSAAGNGGNCTAEGGDTKGDMSKFEQSTTLSTECISGMGFCPKTSDAFVQALQANSNWAPIDRNLNQCLSIWSKLSDEVYVKDIEDIMKARNQDDTDLRRRLTDLRRSMELEWHLSMLELPKLCKDEVSELKKCENEEPKRKCGDEPDCSMLDSMQEALESGNDEVARENINRKWQDLKNTMEDLKRHATQKMAYHHGCKELDWCSKPFGTCEWNDEKRKSECKCKTGYYNERCSEKHDLQHCSYYTEAKQKYNARKELENRFGRVRTWLDVAGRHECEDAEYAGEMPAEYAGRISDRKQVDGGPMHELTFVCINTDECTPEKFGEDCCDPRVKCDCQPLFGGSLEARRKERNMPEDLTGDLENALKGKR